MRVDFEWEAVKADANARKHRVGFGEALTVFADPLARIFDDPDHSAREQREIIVGHSTQQRLLLVSFTELQRQNPDRQRTRRHEAGTT
jgi:uncharacterized DUF497 family protein